MKIINKTDKNKCNCVLWLRERLPELPTGLWTLEDKEEIINSPVPYIGGGAIIADGIWFIHEGAKVFSGHVALVTDIEDDIITIREANYLECVVTERKGTKADLKIVGFFVPDRIKKNQMKNYYITSELRDELEKIWKDFEHEDKESQKKMAKKLDDHIDELEKNEEDLVKSLNEAINEITRLEKELTSCDDVYKQAEEVDKLVNKLEDKIVKQKEELEKLRGEKNIIMKAFEIISNFLNRWKN